jgi:hypothetical protein
VPLLLPQASIPRSRGSAFSKSEAPNPFVLLHFVAGTRLSGAGKRSVQHWYAMNTFWKRILMGAAVLSAGGPAFAQNQPLTCWYNDHADFTSAESAAADAIVGAVTKYGSGDKTYNYTISARDGTACPVQLPLSSLTAVTVALVRQDEGSCSNENVADNGSAALGGSVTIARATEESSTAGIRLVGVSPNTSYRISLKCARQLGTVRTDADGNAGRTVDFANAAAGDVYAFEIAPEGAAPGTKLQSLSFKK